MIEDSRYGAGNPPLPTVEDFPQGQSKSPSFADIRSLSSHLQGVILAHLVPLITDVGKKVKVVPSFGLTMAAYVLAVLHGGEDATSGVEGDSAAT